MPEHEEILKLKADVEGLKSALTPMRIPSDETLDRFDELLDRVEALIENFEGKADDA
jgi:hypothetical protein